MDIDTLEGLKHCPLYAGLSDKDIISLMHSVCYRVIRYRKGEFFTHAGMPCQHIDIVIKGEMTALLVGPTGRFLRMSLHHAGNMLAPAFVFAADNHYPVTVEASTDSQVVRMMPEDLKLLLSADTRVMLNFVHILSNNVSFLTKKVAMLSMTIREKVEQFLHEEQKRQQSDRIHLGISRQMLAEQFGIQKYSLQRCLSELQQEGKIRLEGKNIQILK